MFRGFRVRNYVRRQERWYGYTTPVLFRLDPTSTGERSSYCLWKLDPLMIVEVCYPTCIYTHLRV